MADTLLNPGTLSSLIQAKVAMEREKVYEQNSLIEMGRLQEVQKAHELQREQLEQNNKTRQATLLLKLADDDRVRANPELGDAVLEQVGSLAGVPSISKASLSRARTSYRELLDNMINGNREGSTDAYLEVQIRSTPEDAAKLMTNAKSLQGLQEYTENVEAMRQLNAARFEKIHNAEAKVNAGQMPYAQAVTVFDRALSASDDPTFKAATAAGMRGDPWGKFHGLLSGANTMAEQYQMKAKEIQTQLDGNFDLPRGVTKRDLMEQANVSQKLFEAYTTLGEWAAEPYDKGRLKAARKAQSTIEEELKRLGNLKTDTQAEVLALRKESQAFRESEAGKKHTQDQAQNFGQQEYVRLLQEQKSPQEAATLANALTKKEFGVLPDSSKYVDPAKKGKLEVGITSGTKGDLEKDVLGFNPLMQTIGDIRAQVARDPTSVGSVGSIQRFFGGIGQQMRDVSLALFQQDQRITPSARKKLETMFNTSASDKVEAFTIGLTYKLARVLSGGGVLSDYDLKQASDMVGGLKAASGSTQFLNHLDVIELEARRKAEQSSRVLQSGKLPAVSAPESAPTTATDYLKSLGIDVP